MAPAIEPEQERGGRLIGGNHPLLFSLTVSLLLHLLIALVVFLLQPGSSSALVQSNPGFSIAFSKPAQESKTSEGRGQQREEQENPQKDGSAHTEGTLSQSIGRLKQNIEYPPLAVSQEMQGTVVAYVSVQEGNLIDFQIRRSSGHRILDEAVHYSVRKWSWPRITAQTTFTVVFQLVAK